MDEYERELVREIITETQNLVTAHMRSYSKDEYRAEAVNIYDRINVISKRLLGKKPGPLDRIGDI